MIYWKEKLRKQSRLKFHQKRIKYLRINLTKEMKDVYTENDKSVRKETEEETNKWKDILFSWNGTINIVKISMLPKAVDTVNAIPPKIPWYFPPK